MSDEKLINHHTRDPHQPDYATLVEGEFDDFNWIDHDNPCPVPYVIRLTRKGPGNVELTLMINGKVCGLLPFDNLVKAATRIDPDHAVGAEAQIQKLRRETADAKAEMYDWQARAKQLEEKLRAFEEASKV
jgi:hypothetical protein